MTKRAPKWRSRHVKPAAPPLDGMDYVEATVDAEFDDLKACEEAVREQYGRLKDADD